MRKLTAIACCAFIVGCSATTTVEENVPVGDDVPVTDNNAIVPRDQPVVFPPLEAPPNDLTQTLPGVQPGTETVEEEPVVSEVPAVELPKPRVLEGNPTCEDAFGTPGLLAMTFEQQRRGELVDGTYSSGDMTITIDFGETSISYTSTGGVVGVIVKGGAHAVAYPSENGAGTDLSTPGGEELSHLTVCYLP